MTDDERIAAFLGWTRCPGEHLLIGTKTCAGWLTASGSHAPYVLELDNSPYGWMALGELAAAIEARRWTLKLTGPWCPPVVMPGPGKYEATIWLEQNMEGRAGFASADNLPEALKLAVLAALEAEA